MNFSDLIYWCASSMKYRNVMFRLSQRMYMSFSFSKCDKKNLHKKRHTRRKTHQSFPTNFETFKVRRENKLPAWFLFSAVNLNFAYKQVGLYSFRYKCSRNFYKWFVYVESRNLSKKLDTTNIFASLSLKTGELKTFLRKEEILELPRRQNVSKMFSVVATTRNSSITHRSRSTTGKKMNSHVVLIKRSSIFNHSRSP